LAAVDIAALVVAIVAAVAAAAAAEYARRSARSAAETASMDRQRRHAELTPHFRVTLGRANPGVDTLRLRVFLMGPPELGRLDGLTVTIRDDHPWRGQGPQLGGGPTAEQVAGQIWGPYRFTPGTGPGADAVRGIPGADPTGRTTPTRGMPVGEELQFSLERTLPPLWSQQTPEDWRREQGTVIRLQLECRRDGWDPWTLAGEVSSAIIAAGAAPGGITEIP
jgi:hypothetical protein